MNWKRSLVDSSSSLSGSFTELEETKENKKIGRK